jgi:glycine betaine/proline transport system ATP-binding protein
MTANKRKKVRTENLWKVFGPNPENVIENWDFFGSDMTKAEMKKQTGCVVGVKEASFQVGQGEIFVIMGLSGSGKSTLLRCVNRLHEPNRGKVFIDDQDVTGLSFRDLRNLRREKTGMVFQHFALLPHRRLIGNVAYGLEIQGVSKRKREQKAMESLDLVGLKGWEKNYPNELSGGMQQRVGLARALATDPEILLMDEAFSALDPLIRRQMQDEFIKLLTQVNKTIIFVTHDLHEALRLADYIAVMKSGAIVQQGTPEEIVLSPETDYVAEFVKDLPKIKFITANSIMVEPDIWVANPQEPAAKIIQKLEKENLWYALMVGEDQRVKGVVSYRRLVVENTRDEPVNSETIDHDYPTAAVDTFLEDLINIAAKTDIPIVVEDDQKRMVGVIRREHIFNALKTS